jgi:hypothetical protein
MYKEGNWAKMCLPCSCCYLQKLGHNAGAPGDVRRVEPSTKSRYEGGAKPGGREGVPAERERGGEGGPGLPLPSGPS